MGALVKLQKEVKIHNKKLIGEGDIVECTQFIEEGEKIRNFS